MSQRTPSQKGKKEKLTGPSNAPPATGRSASLRSANKPSGGSSQPTPPSPMSSTPALASSASRAPPPSSLATPVPRLPSHMAGSSRRGPLGRASVEEVEDEGDQPPQRSATYVSALSGNPLPGSPTQTRSAFMAAHAGGTGVDVQELVSRLQDNTMAARSSGAPSSVGPLSTTEETESSLTTLDAGPSPPIENESITAALRASAPSEQEYERFFSRRGIVIDLYREPLYASVERFHAPYDPTSTSDEDPLLYYGAVDGELPDASSAATEYLRDAVIRYHQPHRNFLWERLSDLVSKVARYEASAIAWEPLRDPATLEEYYGLPLDILEEVAHASVAVQQVLDALHSFLNRKPSTAFTLDPRFSFLYMLEACPSRSELRFYFCSLQLRLVRADKHIRSYLSSIRAHYTGEEPSDVISSVDSTISEVREAFGTEHPTKELYRLMVRKDYGQRAALIDKEEHRRMVESIGTTEAPLPEYYKRRPRDKTVLPTMKERDAPRPQSSASSLAAPGCASLLPRPPSSVLSSALFLAQHAVLSLFQLARLKRLPALRIKGRPGPRHTAPTPGAMVYLRPGEEDFLSGEEVGEVQTGLEGTAVEAEAEAAAEAEAEAETEATVGILRLHLVAIQ
ncbi:hypothetical protein B0H15DRAFT_977057 [Mycena belliarum]|uniref:Uncharacterized protein n=1 Tax=Mycena belliarum TaxID=1033014 RepID=A0AAD6XWD8_9AGAR|nr:hypothetical protein B0H15DRAFT_977057 [Mycena belliae]